MTTTRIFGSVAALALGAALSLSACSVHVSASPQPQPAASTSTAPETQPSASDTPGEPDTSSSPEPSASASSSSDGSTQSVAGTGYTFEVPAGWEPVTDQPKIDRGYKAPQPTNGFYTNVLTNVAESDVTDLTAGADAAAKQLSEDGATDVERGSTLLDGEPAETITYKRTYGDKTSHQKQVFCIRDGKLYTITVSMSADADSSDLDGVLDPVVDSWHWA